MRIKKITSIFNRSFDGFIAGTAAIAGALAVTLMLIVTIDVLLGYFFNKPTEWISDISGYILVSIPFLAGAWILKNAGHVKMDFLVNRLGEKNRIILSIILYIVIAGICGMIIYYGVTSVLTHYKINVLTPTVIVLPKWPLLAIIPFGFILLLIQTLRGIAEQVGKLKMLR